MNTTNTITIAIAPVVGALFKNLRDEVDLGDGDLERITPAGSVWRVTEIAQSYVSIVCEATGAWINPSADELARDFARA